MALDWSQCAAVESIPGKLGGAWVFHGTRIPVSALFDNLQDGLTVDEILGLYEGLTDGHVQGVLEFFSDSLRAEKNVYFAIQAAEALLPGKPAPKGETDLRWQAIMKIEDFIESQPEPVWHFALKWGSVPDAEDLSQAIATLLLEHLLEIHFDLIFPRVQEAVRRSISFASAFLICYKLGQAAQSHHAEEFDKLREEIRISRK
jgi:uncharacterized protein (DUF433 family)